MRSAFGVTSIATGTSQRSTQDPLWAPEHASFACRVISNERLPEARRLGFRERHFFGHRFYLLPKCGPDALKVFRRLNCQPSVENSWQLALYAAPEDTADFPDDLHFGSDIQWHQQHLGRRGLVATANLLIDGTTLYAAVHLSDLVQRISRRRDFKTRVDSRFKGWHRLLLNAIANIAVERRLPVMMTPSAATVLATTPPFRQPQPALFERIYDSDITSMFNATQVGGWWRVDLEDNRNRILRAESKRETLTSPKTIAICHDIESGLGHVGDDPALVKRMNDGALAAVDGMSQIEHRVGVNATYQVVGRLLPVVRSHINGSHALAFHSFDHRDPGSRWMAMLARLARVLGSRAGMSEPFDYQLARCRMIDYRLKGYRPPKSVLGPGATASMLCFYNFEWLASSVRSLGFVQPRMSQRIVWLPLLFDDFDLHRRRYSYEDWERRALQRIRSHRFVAFSLHDCYAAHWLGHYEEFLRKVKDLGVVRTLDDVAADIILANAS